MLYNVHSGVLSAVATKMVMMMMMMSSIKCLYAARACRPGCVLCELLQFIFTATKLVAARSGVNYAVYMDDKDVILSTLKLLFPSCIRPGTMLSIDTKCASQFRLFQPLCSSFRCQLQSVRYQDIIVIIIMFF